MWEGRLASYEILLKSGCHQLLVIHVSALVIVKKKVITCQSVWHELHVQLNIDLLVKAQLLDLTFLG